MDASLINPWHACTARATVLVFVCLLSHISPLECVFVLKILSRTQGGNGGQKICGVFPENALFKSYGVTCHAVASYHADV